jgi:hypothetical protein
MTQARTALPLAAALALLASCGPHAVIPPAEQADKGTYEAAQVVACVLGRRITSGEIGLKEKSDLQPPSSSSCSPNDPVSRLQGMAWNDIAEHYIEAHGLKATPDELREIGDRMGEFRAEDRKRRARDLEKVEEELRSSGLSAEERKECEDRRSTLRSLGEHEMRRDELDVDTPGTAQKVAAMIYAPIVEHSKLDAALYKRFGGPVSITKFGQVPVGARASLLREYKEQGKLEILDRNLELRFWNSWDEPPRLSAPAEKVDLTPFWRLLPQAPRKG